MSSRPLHSLLFVAALSAMPVLTSEEPRPRIVLAEESIDLGTVPRGEVATGSFEIKNEGEATLAILRAKPS